MLRVITYSPLKGNEINSNKLRYKMDTHILAKNMITQMQVT